MKRNRMHELIRPLIAMLTLCTVVLPAAAWGQVNPLQGHWEGALEFRGDAMPVRIYVDQTGGVVTAALDLPGLLMAWEPIPVELTEMGAEVEFPFGIGVLAVQVDGERARAEKVLGEDAFMLRLERSSPPAFTREEVRFTCDGVELVGELVLPPGVGPHPGVVLLHGSTPQGRQNWEYRSWADLLVRKGLAVLYYDKRGVGESGGEYPASLRRLANDGLTAVRYLRSRPEIDPGRIGLKGSSQGAWLAEQIAADLESVAFLLLVSGAGSTPRDQEMQKIEYGMRVDGLPEAAIDSALAYMGLYYYVTLTGEGWPLLQQAISRAQNTDWGQYVDQPQAEEDLLWWRENMGLQPATLVEDLEIPVLLLYGETDWVVPPIENAHKLRSLFPRPELVEVRVYAKADHRLEIPMGPDSEGNWRWPRVAPEMEDVVGRWLTENGLN